MRVVIVALAAMLLWHAASAQEADKNREDPIGALLLPPELIMQHQKAIGLTDAQKTALLGEIKRLQGQVLDLQWELQGAAESLADELRGDRVDEAKAIAKLDKVLAVEREIKRAHFGLGVRVRNLLTPEQQRSLRELRSAQPRSVEGPPQR